VNFKPRLYIICIFATIRARATRSTSQIVFISIIAAAAVVGGAMHVSNRDWPEEVLFDY